MHTQERGIDGELCGLLPSTAGEYFYFHFDFCFWGMMFKSYFTWGEKIKHSMGVMVSYFVGMGLALFLYRFRFLWDIPHIARLVLYETMCSRTRVHVISSINRLSRGGQRNCSNMRLVGCRDITYHLSCMILLYCFVLIKYYSQTLIVKR